MSSDPAVHTAAVALLNGWADPLDLLAQHPEDYRLSIAALNKAEKLRGEQQKAMAEYQAHHTAKQLMPGLAALVRALAKSMST